jgi:hypothetical protein
MSTDLRGHPLVACFQKFPSLVDTPFTVSMLYYRFRTVTVVLKRVV